MLISSAQLTGHNSLYVVLGFLALVFFLKPGLRTDHSHHHHHSMNNQHHDHDMASSSGSSGHNHDNMSMPMTFLNSIHTTLWFKEWQTDSMLSYMLSLAGLVLFAFLHEALTVYRAAYAKRLGESKHRDNNNTEGIKKHETHSMDKLALAALYMLNLSTGYLLMLAVMTYNAGFFAAVVCGMGIGYYWFYDSKMTELVANRGDGCHARLLD